MYLLITVLGCAIVYGMGQLVSIENLILVLLWNIVLSIIIVTFIIVLLFRKTPEFAYVQNIVKKIIGKIARKVRG